ncbi:hypothetical protein AX15_006799 [Amanita polypyramis BW_CC]|nr:hypothetical protein AX15_006799 [Amanita polypyramis BW_CC]
MPTRSPRSRATLQALSRSELQALAKREGIKANLKSENIIGRLLQKYPEGYPRSLAPSPVEAPLPQTNTGADVIQPDRSNAEDPLTHARIRQANVKPQDFYLGKGSVASIDHHEGLASKEDSAMHEFQAGPLSRQPKQTPEFVVPTKKILRFIRRELTGLVNEKGSIMEELYESEQMLQKNLGDIDSMVRDANELVWMRLAVERRIARKMKKDRTIWDGTEFMSKRSQRLWRQYIEDDKQRRKEGHLPFFHAPFGYSKGAKNMPFVLFHISNGKDGDDKRGEDEEESGVFGRHASV